MNNVFNQFDAVTDTHYPKSSNTASQFTIKDTRDFKNEKDH